MRIRAKRVWLGGMLNNYCFGIYGVEKKLEIVPSVGLPLRGSPAVLDFVGEIISLTSLRARLVHFHFCSGEFRDTACRTSQFFQYLRT